MALYRLNDILEEEGSKDKKKDGKGKDLPMTFFRAIGLGKEGTIMKRIEYIISTIEECIIKPKYNPDIQNNETPEERQKREEKKRLREQQKEEKRLAKAKKEEKRLKKLKEREEKAKLDSDSIAITKPKRQQKEREDLSPEPTPRKRKPKVLEFTPKQLKDFEFRYWSNSVASMKFPKEISFVNNGVRLPITLDNLVVQKLGEIYTTPSTFHTANYLFPNNYKAIRRFRSVLRNTNESSYVCEIHGLLNSQTKQVVSPGFYISLKTDVTTAGNWLSERAAHKQQLGAEYLRHAATPKIARISQTECIITYSGMSLDAVIAGVKDDIALSNGMPLDSPELAITGAWFFGFDEVAVRMLLQMLPMVEHCPNYHFQRLVTVDGKNTFQQIPEDELKEFGAKYLQKQLEEKRKLRKEKAEKRKLQLAAGVTAGSPQKRRRRTASKEDGPVSNSTAASEHPQPTQAVPNPSQQPIAASQPQPQQSRGAAEHAPRQQLPDGTDSAAHKGSGQDAASSPQQTQQQQNKAQLLQSSPHQLSALTQMMQPKLEQTQQPPSPAQLTAQQQHQRQQLYQQTLLQYYARRMNFPNQQQAQMRGGRALVQTQNGLMVAGVSGSPTQGYQQMHTNPFLATMPQHTQPSAGAGQPTQPQMLPLYPRTIAQSSTAQPMPVSAAMLQQQGYVLSNIIIPPVPQQPQQSQQGSAAANQLPSNEK